MKPALFWIAINGSSCAMSGKPIRKPYVFTTLQEAKEAQIIALTKPLNIVMENAMEWARRRDVKYLKMSCPDPQTSGLTQWFDLLDPNCQEIPFQGAHAHGCTHLGRNRHRAGSGESGFGWRSTGRLETVEAEAG